MNDLQIFGELKRQVLETYKKHVPYFTGSWQEFGTKEISNLQELVEIHVKERVSEKWIYTHLKTENNDKLPRKDMLDILSQFVGKHDWNEFSFAFRTKEKITNYAKRNTLTWIAIAVFGVISVGTLWYIFYFKNEKKPIPIQNQFTKENIPKEELELYEIKPNQDTQRIAMESKSEFENNSDRKILIKSPFYKPKIVSHAELTKNDTLQVEPDDQAMLLKNFLQNPNANWKNRQQKVHEIVEANAEILVMLKGNLGTESYNKEEFVDMITIPTSRMKKWTIIELKKNEHNKITFIRLLQP